MNRHFEDARYYLLRAAAHTKRGIEEELSPVERRVRTLAGLEPAPEEGRLERFRERLDETRERAADESRVALDTLREQVETIRGPQESS